MLGETIPQRLDCLPLANIMGLKAGLLRFGAFDKIVRHLASRSTLSTHPEPIIESPKEENIHDLVAAPALLQLRLLHVKSLRQLVFGPDKWPFKT